MDNKLIDYNRLSNVVKILTGAKLLILDNLLRYDSIRVRELYQIINFSDESIEEGIRYLDNEGFVEVHQDDEGYSYMVLTDKGKSIEEVVDSMVNWINNHKC